MKRFISIAFALLAVVVFGNTSNAQSVNLQKQYSNQYFGLRYPSSWQVVQDDQRATASTVISLQIMERQTNPTDFRPNVNIIVSINKWRESTTELAKQTSTNNRKVVPSYREVGITNVTIAGCKGSRLEYICTVNGYSMRGVQYIVKKPDNTTFIITATTDNNKHTAQSKVTAAIINSLVLK